MKNSRKSQRLSLQLAATLLLGSAVLWTPLAHAGLLGAINDVANAADDSGVNVPNSVYAAGQVANDLQAAGQEITPTTPQPAPQNTGSCPPGYSCTPQASAPICPPGDTCTPQSAVHPQSTETSDNAILQSQLGFSILPREQTHLNNPNYIQFAMPTRSFIAMNDPIIETIGNAGHYTKFEVSRNNRQLPYLSPAQWQKYIVETYRLWPSAASISTQILIPGDTHGGLYTVSEANYQFATRHAVSFFMGDAQGAVKIAEERSQGQHVPNLWVIMDPDCTLSHDFFLQAEKYADAGQIDIHAMVTGLDAGSAGRAEAILSSRVAGASGAGVGEMAENTLAQDYNDFSYSPEVGGIAPMHGDATARHLVHVNDRLAYAIGHTYASSGEAVVYPTMLFRYQGTDYLYANIHSSPLWYTALLNKLAGV